MNAQDHTPRDSIAGIAMALPHAMMGWRDVLLLIAGYVVLDWASYIHASHGVNITPWSPAAALGLVFAMRFGPLSCIALFVAIVLAEMVIRDLPMDITLRLTLALVLALGYTGIGEIMRRRFDPSLIFDDRAQLLAWMMVVIVGTLVVGLAFVSTLVIFGVITTVDFVEALARYWIGDMVGVLITMPLVAMLMDERGRGLLMNAILRWETIAYSVATVIAVGIALGLSAESDIKYFYVVFVPLVWAASRQGLAGAVVSAALAQLAIIVAAQLRGFPTVTVFEIQALTVVLVLVGFLVGVVIDEQIRTGSELRQSLRLAAAGDMAGALAHELNQPLTAMSAYATACEDLINRGERGDQLLEMVRHMVNESQRTSAVVTRLRDFFRTGDTKLDLVELDDILRSAVAAFSGRAERNRVEIALASLPDATLFIDRLQIEVVIRNLLANAFDAAESQDGKPRSIRLSAERLGDDRVCIRVEDSGPGLGNVSRLFEPFRSTKSSGLGLGLAISRSIVEAHGGKLWAEAASHGSFMLMLPLEQAERT